MHDKQGFEEAADKFGLSKEEIWDIRKQFTAAGSGEEIEQFKQRLDEVFSADRKQELTAILAEWKDTYRKNCKI